MALQIADRVKETTTTTSTGTYALAGAVDGFQSFAAVGNGNTTYYACTDGTDYEVGLGSYTASGTTLTRVTILESSNSDAAVNWGAGTKEIFVTVPAEKYLVRDASGNVSLTGNLTISGTVDGRDVANDGSKLDGIEANAKNDQMITAGGGLTGGGTGDVTLSHSDTSSVSSTDNSGNTFVQDLTFDTYGHVTAVGTGSVSVGDGTLTVQGTGALGGSGTFTANQSGNKTISISHDDTSSQASVNGSGRTYIQDVTLDAYGHVTGLATATETVVNTDTNTTDWRVQNSGGTQQFAVSAAEGVRFAGSGATSVAFDASTQKITISSTDTNTDTNTIPNNATITLSAGNALTGGGNFTTDQSSNETITFNHSDTSSQSSVNNSGRTYIQDITLDGYGHVTGISSATETVVNTDTNTNQLTTFVVEDGDGTEVTISQGKEWKFTEAGGININWTDTSTGSDGDPFDLSFNVSTSINAGGGLTGGGQLNATRTISHADTSSQGSVNNSGRTYIQDITLDAYGHITGISSATETVVNTDTNTTNFNIQANGGTQVNISAGEEINFINGNATTAVVTNQANPTVTFNHNDTSSQASVNNSGRTYIQDITLDAYGHITGIASATETVVNTDTNTTYSAGTNLSLSGTTFNVSANPSFTDVYVDDQIISTGDTNTYMQFHAADQWRVVVGGSERLEVKNSSPHVLVSGDLNSSSDEALKKNIKPIDNALADICQLEGVTFDWRDTGTQGQGFIAQQVEPIIPDVVNTDEDTGMKSINYVGLIGHLVEAIKTQQTQIDDLKAEIRSMKS